MDSNVKNPADWAYERADALTYDRGNGFYRTAFARYIEEHEEPPVDPLLFEAGNIAADYIDQEND